MKITITRADIKRAMPDGPMAFENAGNIALSAVLARTGLRFKPASPLGFRGPILSPPWQIAENFEANGWDVSQGEG